MAFRIRIVPITVVADKIFRYKFSILGFELNHKERDIGFDISKHKYADRYEWRCIISLYGLMKEFTVSTHTYLNGFTCPDCGLPLWRHNLYCDNCSEIYIKDEVIKFTYTKKPKDGK